MVGLGHLAAKPICFRYDHWFDTPPPGSRYVLGTCALTAGTALSVSVLAVLQQFRAAGSTLSGKVVAVISLILAVLWPAFCALMALAIGR